MNKTHPVLEISQLTVNYDKTPALWDISLQVPSGMLVGIIGPNGAGKSTLIKSVLQLVNPISGRVEFFGLPLNLVRERIAYVPQRESVDWDFPIRVRELVMMGRYGQMGIFRGPKNKDWEAVDFYLDQVGMLPYAYRQISQLSGGQQQRVFIARALAQEADVYFMDEPFAGIDMASENVLVGILKELKQKGKTVFIVHHDLNSVEKYFDWLILLNIRLIACGKTHQVFNSKTIEEAYGRSYILLDEALRLSQSNQAGIPS